MFCVGLLLEPIAIFSQTLPVDPTSPDTQNATRAPSTEKKPGQKPAAPTPEPRKEIAGGKTAQEIANEANNPAAPVTLIQFRDILLPKASVAGVLPGVNGASGTVNSLQMQPVLPIGPFKSFPLVQLMKLTMPFSYAS